jgi:hypothetical protein
VRYVSIPTGISTQQSLGRYSDHRAPRWRFFEDNGTGTHDRLLADYRAGEHNGAYPDVREPADAHPPAQDNARRDMYVRFDSAIVLDYRSGIYDAVFADDRPRIDNYSWHHDTTRSDAR